MTIDSNRRAFLRHGTAAVAAALLPVTLVDVAQARGVEPFTFAVLSDAHLQQMRGAEFVRSWDRGLRRAIAEVNLLTPAPDFVVFGGDLAHAGRRDELDHGAELLSALRAPVRHVVGEHDYYLDLGNAWSQLFGAQWYSFDHKGVHFIVLNSVLTDAAWMDAYSARPRERMEAVIGLGQAGAPAFQVGDAQRAWLAQDLRVVSKPTPIVVLSHAPLQRLYRGWNFWTEDSDAVHALLRPFDRVTVIYGHVHQLQYSRVGNITFFSAMSTAWPYPYPESYAQAVDVLPTLSIPENRADPFFERDGAGWQFINLASVKTELYYNLYNNPARSVIVNAHGDPEDTTYAAAAGRVPSQQHY